MIDQLVGRGAALGVSDGRGAAAAEVEIAGHVFKGGPAVDRARGKIKRELLADMLEVGVGFVRQVLIAGKADFMAPFTEFKHAFEVCVDRAVAVGHRAEFEQAQVLVDRVAYSAVAVHGVVLKAVGQSRFIGWLVQGFAYPIHM